MVRVGVRASVRLSLSDGIWVGNFCERLVILHAYCVCGYQ